MKIRDFHYLIQAKKRIEENYSPDYLNPDYNHREAAGQSVWHLHLHIIPRYVGDVDNPKGGVRWVIPEASQYSLSGK